MRLDGRIGIAEGRGEIERQLPRRREPFCTTDILRFVGSSHLNLRREDIVLHLFYFN
jgi:hypothetical protein